MRFHQNREKKRGIITLLIQESPLREVSRRKKSDIDLVRLSSRGRGRWQRDEAIEEQTGECQRDNQEL